MNKSALKMDIELFYIQFRAVSGQRWHIYYVYVSEPGKATVLVNNKEHCTEDAVSVAASVPNCHSS
jgi:hypothetical protein